MDMEKLFLEFMKEAGEIAVSYQDKITNTENHCKEDTAASVVTEADTAISKKFKEFLTKEIDHDDYVIIDEETIGSLGDDKYKTVNEKTYQFVIDPIDGTLPYSLGMPMYGIVVGMMKNMKPYLGAVYCPGIGELVVYGGKEVKRYKNPFNDKEKVTVLTESDKEPVLIFPKPSSCQIDSFRFNRKKEVSVDFYATAIHAVYLALGLAKAFAYSVSLWDIAGAWPILNKLGLKFFNAKTGKELTSCTAETFSDAFKVKDVHIICKERDFKRIQELIILKKK